MKEMKCYCVGPKVALENGDTTIRSLDGYAWERVDAETPAKAKKIYAERTGCGLVLKAEFICLA